MRTCANSTITIDVDELYSMDRMILSPIELSEFLSGFRSIIKEELQAQQKLQLEEKLLSPAEACKLFQPAISKQTLAAWTSQNLLQDHRFGGRVFYKYSEIIEAGKKLKRYQKK